MNIKKLFTMVMIIGILLTGCRSNIEISVPVEEIPTPVKEQVKEEATATPVPTATPYVPKILKFVDAFQAEYECEIDPMVEPCAYDKDLFVPDGDFIKYDDDDYTTHIGIDISKFQGNVDFEKVKESGVEFVIIRAAYRGYSKGNIKTDPYFERNITNALSAGLDVGAYFYSQAINEEEAREEALYILDLADGRELNMGIVYDPESVLDDVARTDNLTKEQFTLNSQAFLSTISENGYKPVLYCNMLWEAFNLNLSELKEYDIWYADYESKPQTPYAFSMWQYTNEGRVPGVSGDVDINICLTPK